jgi:hypothetical protein
LLAFVIARKMLKPDLQSYEIALNALAFVLLLGARRYLLPEPRPKQEAATDPTTGAPILNPSEGSEK